MTPYEHKPEYGDSGEFTNDLHLLKDLSDKLTHIVSNPAFKKWLEDTDNHFSTVTRIIGIQLSSDAKMTGDSIDRLAEEIDRADRG